MLIEIFAVCHNRLEELKVFVQSWINQTERNWILTVIHDGPNPEFEKIMKEYQKQEISKIKFFHSEKRFNDYGHSLRELAIKISIGDYILLTNADNYFIPKAIHYLNQAITSIGDVDIVMYDMIHSHERPGGRALPAYSYFEVNYQRGSIDISAAIVKRELAIKAGFKDKTHDGDASYFEDIQKAKSPNALMIAKIRRVLFVHN